MWYSLHVLQIRCMVSSPPCLSLHLLSLHYCSCPSSHRAWLLLSSCPFTTLPALLPNAPDFFSVPVPPLLFLPFLPPLLTSSPYLSLHYYSCPSSHCSCHFSSVPLPLTIPALPHTAPDFFSVPVPPLLFLPFLPLLLSLLLGSSSPLLFLPFLPPLLTSPQFFFPLTIPALSPAPLLYLPLHHSSGHCPSYLYAHFRFTI